MDRSVLNKVRYLGIDFSVLILLIDSILSIPAAQLCSPSTIPFHSHHYTLWFVCHVVLTLYCPGFLHSLLIYHLIHLLHHFSSSPFSAVEYSAEEDSEIDYGYSEERKSSSGSAQPMRITDLEASFGSFKGKADWQAFPIHIFLQLAPWHGLHSFYPLSAFPIPLISFHFLFCLRFSFPFLFLLFMTLLQLYVKWFIHINQISPEWVVPYSAMQ